MNTQLKKLACIGAKCAFSVEGEIAVLDADTEFPLLESFHLSDRLNCSCM